MLSSDFLLFEALLSRWSLSTRERDYYQRLQKGVIGERSLINFLQALDSPNIIPLFDLRFQINEQEIKIDCLLLTSDSLFLLEVKNYKGDYYYENHKFYQVSTRKEIYNPITQLERTEFLFKKLLQDLRVSFPLRSFLVFINPSFYLYQSPILPQFLYYGQIEGFFQSITKKAPPLTKQTLQLKEELMSRKIERSKYGIVPDYRKEELKRGLFCPLCHYNLDRKGQLYLYCRQCKERFHVYDTLLHAIAQFQLLFPEEKITTGKITDWCGQAFSRVFISRFLKRHLKMQPNGSYTYYTFNNKEEVRRLLAESYAMKLERKVGSSISF